MRPKPSKDLRKFKVGKSNFVFNKFSTNLRRNINVQNFCRKSQPNANQLVCIMITFPINMRHIKPKSRQKMQTVISSIPKTPRIS